MVVVVLVGCMLDNAQAQFVDFSVTGGIVVDGRHRDGLYADAGSRGGNSGNQGEGPSVRE